MASERAPKRHPAEAPQGLGLAFGFSGGRGLVVANPRHDEGQRLFNILHTHTHTHIHENTQRGSCMIASASLKLRRPSSSAAAAAAASVSA